MPAAADIRVIVSDVDGVWTDGKIIYSGEQREIKNFNVRDGLGAKLAQKAGLVIALITSRRSPALIRRARELGIDELHQGASNKLAECEKVAKKLGATFGQILHTLIYCSH
jgi:3-deoxy-D-manno-octulosonate 8-phosphate phosphatase (KDO 8-P phosphatase)